jgi:hypothetical protein
MLTAAGHGYGYQCFEKRSIVSFVYSVDLSHASGPTLSGGYTLIASDVLPSGRLIRAASHTNAGEALHTTSRVWSMWKCHVSVPPCLGRLAGSFTSEGVRMYTVLSLSRARASLAISVAVSTSFGFINSPEPATIIAEGTVT